MEDTERQQKRNAKLDVEIELAKMDLELKQNRIELMKADLEDKQAITRRLLAEAEAEELKTASLRIEVETRQKAYEEMLSTNRYHHVYRFDEEINEATVDHCMERLNMWHRTSPGCDMEIIFNSGGGSVIYGMELFDFIGELRHTGHKITTGARGIAASMASILLQAGDDRWMGKHTTLMIHQPSGVIGGKTEDLHDQLDWLTGLQEQALEIYAQRCVQAHERGTATDVLTKEEIKKRWARRDFYINAADALKYGFVDRIVG